MNEIYPLKFVPILKDKIWGGNYLKTLPGKEDASEKCGESWEISCLEDDISIVREGFLKGNTLQELIEVYMGDLLGDIIFDRFGLEFPLLIKFIEAKEKLSIQVHPDDETALERHNSFGKTEMWYIMESEKDARLITGFNRETNPEEYTKYLDAGKITELLNYEKVERGDIFFLPAGRIHAIEEGIVLAEIQQTSDITYRIFDYNRPGDNGQPRELHNELALNVIDFKKHNDYKTIYERALNKTVPTVSCPFFTTNLIRLNQEVHKDYTLLDSFIIYICTEGKAKIIPQNQDAVSLSKGETLLIPAMLKNITIKPEEETVLLEVYVG